MAEAAEITFEQGYRRLQEIAERVNADEVPVQEMCDLFAEGKGLDKALSNYLAEQKARVEKIEAGDEIHAFKIVTPTGDPVVDRDRDENGKDDAPEDVPADTADFSRAPAGPGAADDDIPF